MAQTPAVMRHTGDAIDYTPGSDTAAGTVVVTGSSLVGITTVDLPANKKGAVAVRGVFNVPKDNSNVAAGDALYWDDDANPVGGTAGSGAFTSNSSLGPFAGWALAAAGTGVGMVDMLLRSADDGSLPGSFAYLPTATVAAAGSDNTDAAVIDVGFTLVTGANDTKGVKLPTAAAGKICIIKVGDGADLKVYPNTGDAINKGTVTTGSITVVDDVCFMLIAHDATDWYTLPLLPS